MVQRKWMAGAALLLAAAMALAGCGKDNGESVSEADFASAFQYIKELDGKITITEYLGTLTDIVIPKRVGRMPVAYIGDEAFLDKGLTSVTIPDSVTSIGDEAFRGNQLTSIAIPATITSIGDGTFRGNQLTSVVLPDSVASIGDRAFYSNRLTSIIIPAAVASIGDYAFYMNPITSVAIGANLELSITAFYLALGPDNDRVSSAFEDFYNDGGKQAGTYTRPNVSSETWTKQ